MKANSDDGFSQVQHFLASAPLSVPISYPTPPCLVSSGYLGLCEVPQTHYVFHPLFPQLPIAGLLTAFRTQPKCNLLYIT